MTTISKKASLTLWLLLAFQASHASLVTSNSIGFEAGTVDFDQFESAAISGSVEIGAVVGESIYLESSPDGLIVTTSQSAAFGDNGSWDFFDGPGAFTASSSGDDPVARFLSYTFNDGLVSSVGGFINYCTGPYTGCGDTDVTISAIALDGSVLESYNLLVDAPIAPEGEFRGIIRASNDIAAFRVSSTGTFFALDNLAYDRVAVVPVPASVFLFISGLVGMFGFSRQRKSLKN